MIAPARKFSILLMPSLRMLAQSKPGGTSGLMYWDLVVILYCGCACEYRACEDAPTPSPNGFAAVANWLKASRETPVSATNRPIKTRRLKNPPSPRLRRAGADCDVDFFFMSDGYGRVEFERGTSLVSEIPETRQHFFYFFLLPGSFRSAVVPVRPGSAK